VLTGWARLSQMILDKKFDGVLDQGDGCLLVNETLPSDVRLLHSVCVRAYHAQQSTYPASMGALRNMNSVLDVLFDKCKKL
jgi:hypothetical protein